MIRAVVHAAIPLVIITAVALPLVPYLAFNPHVPAKAARRVALAARHAMQSVVEVAGRLGDVLAALPRPIPGATLDPAMGGQAPPLLDVVAPAGWAEMPTDAHRIVVPAADLDRAARMVPISERRFLRVDWRAHVRPLVLTGRAA